jgi:hypothetical protein
MNTFKQKSLYAALAGLSALGATGIAEAVSVNPMVWANPDLPTRCATPT